MMRCAPARPPVTSWGGQEMSLSIHVLRRYTLREAARSKRLDMTDAFESYAGKSREANLGVMAKGRFQAAMGDIFKGIPYAALKVISREYGAGDPDPRDPGGFMQVKWKQFAIDFDEIELAPTRGPDPEDMKDMLPALLQLRRVATKQKLDLTDAFEEAAGKGRDAQLGLMAKNRRGQPPHARAHAPAVRCGARLWQLSSRPRLRSPRAGLRRRWA